MLSTSVAHTEDDDPREARRSSARLVPVERAREALDALDLAWPRDYRAVASALRRLNVPEGAAAGELEGFRTQFAMVRERCGR